MLIPGTTSCELAAVRRSPGEHVTAPGCLAAVGDGARKSGHCRKALPALRWVRAAHRLVQLCRVRNAHCTVWCCCAGTPTALQVWQCLQDVEELLLLRAVPQSVRLRHLLGMRRGANESRATLFIKPRGLADHLQLPCIYQDLCVAWLSSPHTPSFSKTCP